LSSTVECDVLIVGGGLVGSTLALALAQTPLRTVLVEERDPRRLEQPSFDARATALANGSRRILQGLGLWRRLGGDGEPILSIHISERGRFGTARILAREEKVPALGYTLENRVLGKAIWESLGGATGFTCLAPGKLRSLVVDATGVSADVAVGDAQTEVSVAAKVVVGADGTRSKVRAVLGIDSREDDYQQHAVVVNCAMEAPHAGRAFERFTSTGPVAVLPLTDSRVAVVWTLAAEQSERILGLGESEFRTALQNAFGFRLGRIRRVGERSVYPLTRSRSMSVIACRAVLIGSAAINLHPVAGQGFNLALRDIATLAEMLSDNCCGVTCADAGDPAVLARYHAWRSRDQRRVAALTHGLIRLFGVDSGPLAVSRGLGLMAFDAVPGAKGVLARQTMGLAGRSSRLARGLPLVP